jgi:hypothetical protein
MQYKIDRSLVYRVLICAFILFIVTACVSPVVQQLPTRPNPEANSTAAAEPTPTNEPAKQDSTFPFTLSENILPEDKITNLTNVVNPGNFQMAQDGQGILHVIWSSIHQLFHRERDAGGQWSDTSAFPTNDNSDGEKAELLIAPDGKACVLWLNEGMVENNQLHSEFQVEQYATGQWSPSAELTSQFDSLAPLLTYTTIYQAQFEPNGHLQLFFKNDTGSDPAQGGYYVGNLRLFPDEDTSKDESHQFMIDQQGNYHLVFLRNNQVIYRISNDQGKTWREPAIQTGTTIDEEYASLAPDQKAYFHFMILDSGSPTYLSWISSGITPQGLPLFNSSEMFKKLVNDSRYQKLISFHPQAMTQDASGRLHFTADDSEAGFSQVILEKNGSWSIQKIENSGFPIGLLVGKKNETYFLWRTNMDALFVSILPG